jgi:hypothetical protein
MKFSLIFAFALVLGFFMLLGVNSRHIPGPDPLANINGSLIVSSGRDGDSTLLKFGYNTSVDDAEESVSEVNDATGDNAGPPRCILDTIVIGVLSISSDDANDAGLEITIEGVDSNWDALTIVQDLGVAASSSGTVYTAVGAPAQWRRVNRAYVSDSTATQGVVYVHNDISDSGNNGIPDIPSTQTRAVINPTEQQTLHACYTIPDDFTQGLHITQWCVSNLTGGAGNPADLRLRSLTEAGVSRTQSLFSVGSGVTFCETYDPPRYYAPRTALEITAITASGVSDANVSGTINGYLLK